MDCMSCPSRRRWRRTALAFALMAGLASLLAACASTGASASAPLYPLLPTSTPAPTITPVPTATSSPIPTATLTVYAPTCTASQLQVKASFGGVAMTQVSTHFTFTNVSSMPCSLLGFPSLRLFDTAGNPLAVKVEQASTAYLWNGVVINKVQLEPGGAAYFETETSDAPDVSGDVCLKAASVIVYAPGSSAGITVTPHYSYGTCDGAVDVSPIVAQLSEL